MAKRKASPADKKKGKVANARVKKAQQAPLRRSPRTPKAKPAASTVNARTVTRAKKDPAPRKTTERKRKAVAKKPSTGTLGRSPFSFPFPSSLLAPCSSSSNLIKDHHQPTPVNTAHTFADLVGIDDIIEDIKKFVVDPFAYPDKCAVFNLLPTKGLLLTGQPGTGKTVLAHAITHAINELGRATKLFVETGQCLTQFVGETEAKLRALFKAADEQGPSVIFMDELDGLARRRSGSSSSDTMAPIMSTLLTCINSVNPGRVLLIAATNVPDLIDPAVLRTGRFDRKVQIGLPNQPARRAIMKHHLSKLSLEMRPDNLTHVVTATDTWTGAELAFLSRAIHGRVCSRLFPNRSYTKMEIPEITKIWTKGNKQINYQRDVAPSMTDVRPVSGSSNLGLYS